MTNIRIAKTINLAKAVALVAVLLIACAALLIPESSRQTHISIIKHGSILKRWP